MQEFIVELTTTIPEGAEQPEVDARWAADNVRIKELAANVLSTPLLQSWMDVKVTALRPHPKQPGSGVSPAWCRTPEVAR
jgi:muconolactone delta-isomerase